jgi:hypothetical protein
MGFSFIGTLIGILIVLPSILFFIKFPPKNIPADLTYAGVIYTILERVGQICCLTVLVMSKDNFQSMKANVWTLLMMFCIIVYYCLWIRYVVKGHDYNWLWKPLLFIPIPLAIFPVCAFLFAALWGKSVWLGIAVVVLAIGHITISWHSYKCANSA